MREWITKSLAVITPPFRRDICNTVKQKSKQMRTTSNNQSVIMEVEFFRNGDNSIGLRGKEPDGSHGLFVQIVGKAGETHGHPDLYQKLATILREHGFK
jgi:hypothetical protein